MGDIEWFAEEGYLHSIIGIDVIPWRAVVSLLAIAMTVYACMRAEGLIGQLQWYGLHDSR